MFKCRLYVLVSDLPLARVKVGEIFCSPREPFEYFGEPFSNLISLDNQYLGKTIYFPGTESIIWRMVLFYLNIWESESESESVSGRIFVCLAFGELLFSDYGTPTATTATTMGVSDMCNKTSVTDAESKIWIRKSVDQRRIDLCVLLLNCQRGLTRVATQ